MKIAVATFCLGYNYGAMLQAYATIKALESLGHEVILINQHQPWSFGVDEKNWRSYVSLKPWVIKYKWHVLWRQRKLRKCFQPMWQLFPLTEYYGVNIESIIKNPPVCDCLITGSDQTWNTSADQKFYAAYFLPFGSSNIKRIAYAPSLGGVHFKSKDLPWILDKLNNYSAISVREKEDVDYLRSLGLENVVQMPDPTLIADKKIYESFIASETHKSYDVVMYILGGKNKRLEQSLYDLLKKEDVDFSNVLNITLQDFFCKNVINKITTVQGWVDAIANAKMVVTNSFHAVVFSLIFNRPFVYINFSIKECNKNNRVKTILEGTSQRFRMIDINELNSLKPFRVYPDFRHEIDMLQEKGLKYLIESLY